MCYIPVLRVAEAAFCFTWVRAEAAVRVPGGPMAVRRSAGFEGGPGRPLSLVFGAGFFSHAGTLQSGFMPAFFFVMCHVQYGELRYGRRFRSEKIS